MDRNENENYLPRYIYELWSTWYAPRLITRNIRHPIVDMQQYDRYDVMYVYRDPEGRIHQAKTYYCRYEFRYSTLEEIIDTIITLQDEPFYEDLIDSAIVCATTDIYNHFITIIVKINSILDFSNLQWDNFQWNALHWEDITDKLVKIEDNYFASRIRIVMHTIRKIMQLE
jgi:hypothetical protein